MTSEDLKKKKIQAFKALDKYNKLIAEVKENCHHPVEQITMRENYYGGDYLNTAYTEYWNECNICGVCSEKTTKDHNYYG